jgi:hypothetical protein
MILDFIGGILLTTAMVVNITAVISILAISRTARLALATLAGLWIGLQVSLASAGAFASVFASTFPLLGAMLAVPLIAVVLAAYLSGSVRAALLALPMPLLVGLNFMRIFGVLFLLLAASGRLGGPFPQFAGWGDIVVGVLALPLAWYVARAAAPVSAAGWNYLGAADLLLAVTLGTLSANGFAFQLIEAGAGSQAITYLPWSLIPTVLVPFYLILHGVIFAQLRARAGGSNTASIEARVA